MLNTPSPPILPFIEANQGLISVATLAFALLIALLEMHRANNAQHERVREAVRVVREILIGLSLRLSIETTKLGEIGPAAVARQASNAFDVAADAIDAVRASAPPSARLLIELADIKNELRTKRIPANLDSDAVGTVLRMNAEAIVSIQERLRQCLPNPMRMAALRLVKWWARIRARAERTLGRSRGKSWRRAGAQKRGDMGSLGRRRVSRRV